MDITKYEEIKSKIRKLADLTEQAKRPSYAGTRGSVTYNFFRDAELLNIDPLAVVLVHMLKQIGAMISFYENPNIIPSESLASRTADVINYAPLFCAVAEEMGRDIWTGEQHAKEHKGSQDV